MTAIRMQAKGFLTSAAVAALILLMAVPGVLEAGEPFDSTQGRPAKPPAFTKKPAVARNGERTVIAFAVDRETDVAVYVENAKGEIVRHLAAGVLGPKAPEPLKAGALEQSVEWDGKDDLGQPAAGGPFKVRVAAGLKVSYAGTVFSEKAGPNNIADTMGMAVAPDGRLYVLAHRWQKYVAFSTAVHVFRRDGSYERTIKPFPSGLAEEQVKATGAFRTREEGLVPLIYRSVVEGPNYYPNFDLAHQPTVTPDGRLVLAVNPCNLAVVDGDGGIPNAKYAGPILATSKGLLPVKGWTLPLIVDASNEPTTFNMPYLAASADGKAVYLTGIGDYKRCPNSGPRPVFDHAIYRAPLPERGPAQVVFGDPAVAGNDDKHLSDPRGIALDGKGRVFVADFGNNRVVVLNEKDWTVAGTFPVEAPFWVGAHPKSGAIYVGAKRTALIKFSGWPDPKEVARADFSALLKKIGGHHSRQWEPLHLALDAGAESPVLWAALRSAPLRLEDRGTAFSDAQPVGAYDPPIPWNLSADPLRREVSCQGLGRGKGLRILNEESGKITTSPVCEGWAEGPMIRLGLNGQILAQVSSEPISRYDRTGKKVPFEATAADQKLKGSLGNVNEGTTFWPRDFSVDRRGEIYVKNRGRDYHGLMTVKQYGPDGALKRIVIWTTGDGALGPRVDPQGNLYMAEGVNPPGQPYPAIFKGRLIAGTKDGSSGFTLGTGYGSMEREYLWMYGSIVKYSPKGGAVWYPPTSKEDVAFEGECKLDPALPKQKVLGQRGTRLLENVELQGALWMRPGYAYLADMSGCGTDRCHCTASEFDVDDFGRVFHPNQGLYRVEILDTNGNLITTVGGYGNQDCCGPDSYVLDPAGKFFRPRKADDPKDLVSPFVEPELAFSWFTGMAVTDRHLYVADGVNRRVLRGKLEYAASETIALP
jgi:DNA-binding beta-propeller fold protein YncE